MADDLRAVKERAAACLKKGQTRKAIQEYEKLLQLQPGDTRTLHKLGELWLKEGDQAKAVDCFLRTANGYLEEGFAERAASVLKQALAVDAAHEGANQLLVDALLARKLEGDAVRHLIALAATCEQQGRAADQQAALERAVEILPDDPDAQLKLGRLHAQAGRPDQARSAFQRAAPALRKAGRMAEFTEVAEKLVELGEDSVELHLGLAEALLAAGAFERAIQVLQRPITAKSDDLRTLGLVARAYFGQGDRNRAVSTYKRIARLARSKGDTESEQQAQAHLDEIRNS